jgi:hypothetical protein
MLEGCHKTGSIRLQGKDVASPIGHMESLADEDIDFKENRNLRSLYPIAHPQVVAMPPG